MPLFKVNFEVECDIMVIARDEKDALDTLTYEDVIDEIRNVFDMDMVHQYTEEITSKKQISRGWYNGDAFHSGNTDDPDLPINEIVDEMEAKRKLIEERAFADNKQLKFAGV